MKKLNVRLTLITEALGTCAANENVHKDWIASKAPHPESAAEEVEAVEAATAQEEFEKSMTIFPRDEKGNVIIWDYQIKGALKSAAQALGRCKGEEFSKATCSLKAYKKIVDTNIFISPRKIPIDTHGEETTLLSRPLRAETALGPRVALATSEVVPAGSTIEFVITCLSDAHAPAVIEWLEYGQFYGLLQWRNGGFGRYVYELLDENGNVIGGNKSEFAVA